MQKGEERTGIGQRRLSREEYEAGREEERY
jgi:hypothetical protein